jgi:hypothetical protein
MNLQDALYTVARKFPDGLDKLAKLMGMSEAVLRMKVSPKVTTHHLSDAEFSEVIQLCHEAGVEDALLPLRALNWKHGLVAFSLPALGEHTDEQLANTVCRVMKEAGDVAASVAESMADGKITMQEMDKIEREFQEALAAMGQWRQRVKDRFAVNQPKEPT